MSGTGGTWGHKAVLAALAIGAIAALAIWLAAGADDDGEARARSAAAAKRQELAEQRARLAAVLRSKREVSVPEPAPAADLEEAEPPPPGGAITQDQGDALREALFRVYDPNATAEALASRRAAAYAREVAESYMQLAAAKTLVLRGKQIAIDAEMAEAIRRMSVMKDYAMNVVHALRPAGEEDRQADLIRRLNDGFRDRVDALNRDYPFLGVRLVEP